LRLRLLHVFGGPFPTVQGTQALVATTCRLLAEAGHDVHLLCYAHSGFEREEPFAVHRIPGAPPFASERSGPSWRKIALDLSLAAACARLAARLRPDAIHAHHYEALFAAALADPLRRTPRVFHVHALMGPELHTYFRPAFARAARAAGTRIDAAAPRLADRALVLDEQARAVLLRHGVPPHRIHVAPVPASPPPGCAPSAERPRRGGSPLRAVYAGNLDAYQGIDILLAAFSAAAPALRGVMALDIVTASDARGLRAEHARLALGELVRVVAHGSVREAWEAVAGADVAVVPRSSPGGFPIKLANALAAGVATIADSALAAQLRHGEDAWLVDMRSPGALAEALVALASSRELRERLARGAAGAAKRLHAPARYLAAVEEAYFAIVPGRGSGPIAGAGLRRERTRGSPRRRR
jgi:glycosyltransferase involved in cell wall biosynthesis